MNLVEIHRQENLDHPLLSASEERMLLERACLGDREAIDRIIKANQRLVMKYANRIYHSGMAGNHDLMDLVQYGNLGLLEAIKRWNGSALRFSTYAVWWVRAIIRRGALTQGAAITRTVREGDLSYMVHKARSALQNRLGRKPTPEEISAQAGVSLHLVNRALKMLNPPLSLSLEDDLGRAIGDEIPSDLDTAEFAESRILQQLLTDAIHTLPPQYYRVIQLRYGLAGHKKATYAEIAHALGVSRTRVQRIEKTALRRLRSALK